MEAMQKWEREDVEIICVDSKVESSHSVGVAEEEEEEEFEVELLSFTSHDWISSIVVVQEEDVYIVRN